MGTKYKMTQQLKSALLALAFLASLISCSQSTNVPQAIFENPPPQELVNFNPTIPISSLTQNNTSACGNATAPCTEAFNQTQTIKYDSGTYQGDTKTLTGFWDNAIVKTSQAPTSTYGVVSKIPMSALLPGYNVPILVETQNWWGQGNGHFNNGQNSINVQQIKNQMADHVSRGVSGQVMDWYGYESNGTLIGATDTEDIVAQNIVANIASYQYGPEPYKFALMIDKGFLSSASCNNTVSCLNAALSYMASKYFSSPYYMKDSNGHPLVYLFVNSWNGASYNLLFDSGINYQNSKFIMYAPDGFGSGAPPQTDGEYDWVNPTDSANIQVSGSAGTFLIDSGFGFSDIESFFNNAKVYQKDYIVGATYKGFDDNLANWSGNRIIDQQCGQTWLNTFDNSGSYGISGASGILNYLKAGYKMNSVMVDTWDDYEEGTEIETGIDNCMKSFTPTLSGNNLTWKPLFAADPMNSKVVGNESTIYKYSIYVGTPGNTHVQWLKDVTPTGKFPYSISLTSFGLANGTYTFYVQAIGMPSIKNTLSTASPSWSAGQGGANNIKVKITAPTTNQNVSIPTYLVGSATNTGGSITAMQVYLNGVLYSTFSDISSVNTPVIFSGTNQTLTLKAWDNSYSGLSEVTGLTSDCTSLQLDLPMPANGVSTTSPVTVNGATCSAYTLSAMEVWDGTVQIYSTELSGDSALINPSLSLSKGTHNLWLKVWDDNPNQSKNYLDTSANKNVITIQ